MLEVDIYIETDSTSPRAMKRQYAYLLECRQKPGNTRMKMDFAEGTLHGVTIQAITGALGRMKQPCEIRIHAGDTYVLTMLEQQLPRWIENDFRNSRGKEVSNREEWEELQKAMSGHRVRTEPGEHIYTRYMRWEMKRKENQDV